MPLLLRSTNPWLPSIVKSRFGVTFTGDWKPAISEIGKAREAMIARLTASGYWRDHLDYTRTDIALVNTHQKSRTDGDRLRWVPNASILLYPVPAQHLISRSPSHKQDIDEAQTELQRILKDEGHATSPADLASYSRFVDAALSRWKKDGAVAVKFHDAYLRTLRIADVSTERGGGPVRPRMTRSPCTRAETTRLDRHLE